MKIAFAITLLLFMIISATTVYADVSVLTADTYLAPDVSAPMNGDSIVLIITALCLSAAALVALLITTVIIKRKK